MNQEVRHSEEKKSTNNDEVQNPLGGNYQKSGEKKGKQHKGLKRLEESCDLTLGKTRAPKSQKKNYLGKRG